MMIQNATRKDLARTLLKSAAATLGLLVCATVFIQTARADCGSYTSTGQKLMPALAQRPRTDWQLLRSPPAMTTTMPRLWACGRCNLCLKGPMEYRTGP